MELEETVRKLTSQGTVKSERYGFYHSFPLYLYSGHSAVDSRHLFWGEKRRKKKQLGIKKAKLSV